MSVFHIHLCLSAHQLIGGWRIGFVFIYLFATQLQLQKDAKKNVGRNGEEA